MALTKVTGQVINTTTDLVVGVTTVGGGISATDAYFSGITTLPNTEDSSSTSTGSLIISGGVGIAKNLSIGGSVSIGGTLTYEDVTNIDSVGLITARNGVSVTGGHVHLNDSRILKLGTDTDAQIVHTGAYGSINVSTGYLVNDIAGDWYVRNSAGSENRIIAKNNGAVELYNDNTKTFNTESWGNTSSGQILKVLAGEGVDATLQLIGDDGDDNADLWQILNDVSAGGLYIQNYASGSWENNIVCNGNGDVELYYDNAKRLETTSTGVDVQTPGAATYLRVLGGQDGDAILRLHADNGDDGVDVWSIFAAQADGKLKIQNGASGSWENSINCNGDGGVDLFHDNVNTFSTMSTGAKVKTSATTSYITMTTSAGDCGFLYANSNTDLSLLDREGHYLFKGIKDGASEVYYDNSSKIVTTSTGCQLKSGAANTTKVHIGTTADRGLEITTVSDGSNNDAQVVFNAADTTSSGYHANLVFQLADVEKARFHGNGDYFQLSNTCTGITFNGDYAAVNQLNDYEEGTWTPNIGTTSGATAEGEYRKIGKAVHIQMYVSIPSHSNSSTMSISGLPFSGMSGKYASFAIGNFRFFNHDGGYTTLRVNQAGTTMTFRETGDSQTWQNAEWSQVNADFAMYVSGTYFTD